MYNFDVQILTWLHSINTPLLDHLAITLTRLGGLIFIATVVTLITLKLLSQRHLKSAATLVLTVGGAGILALLLKLVFHRARPSLWEVLTKETTYSFPSGHAMGSSALAFALIILLWHTKWRPLALSVGIVYMFVVGLTRIYLGVHFPSDVIGGWVISLVWALVVAWSLRKNRKKNHA